MRVLYIVTAYPRHPGDVITPWLVQMIHRLRGVGVQVEVLAPSYRGMGSQEVEGVRVHRFRYAPARWETLTHDQTAPDRIREKPLYLAEVPGYVGAGAVAAARLARSGRFDVIHAFWPIPHGLLGLAARKASGVPLVCTFFGVELTWMRSQLGLLGPVLNGIVRGSDAVTAISTHTAELLEGVAPGVRPVIIPFGAAVSAPPRDAPIRQMDGGPLRLLFVGRLVERKGVHVLLDAVRSIRADTLLRVDVVGDGPERPRLESLARAAGIADRVAFHGFVSREVLEGHLAVCDALVLPAVPDAKGDVEGLGVVLIEAMSFGRPVIASSIGGITDVVRPGETGILVPPGDPEALAAAIEEIARDPALAARMGERARADVRERFSWEAIVYRLDDLYRSLIRSR